MKKRFLIILLFIFLLFHFKTYADQYVWGEMNRACMTNVSGFRMVFECYSLQQSEMKMPVLTTHRLLLKNLHWLFAKGILLNTIRTHGLKN